MKTASVITRLLRTTALLPVMLPGIALADCLPNATGLTVTCITNDPDGYRAGTDNPVIDGVTINVNNGATVGGVAATGPLLSVGVAGAVNNEGTITVAAGETAISVGGGSTVSNAATSTGPITGNIIFAAPTGTAVNTFNNYMTVAGTGTVAGDVTSSGAFVFNNEGDFTGNVSSAGNTTLTNSGSLTGNVSSTGNTTLTNNGSLTGDIILGAGDDTIVNTGTLTGNVDMGAGTNSITFDSTASLPTGTLTADPAGLNTIGLTGTGAATLNIPVTNFDVLNKDGTGSWTLGGAVALADKININAGTLITPDASFLGANTIVNSATLEFTGGADGTYSGNMSGTGAVLVDTGAGVTTFSGTNTYTGLTTISSGTLSLTGGSAIGDTSTVAVGGTGTLDIAESETIGALTDGAVPTGAVTLSGGTLTVGSGSFAGTISGANGLTKTTTGTLVLAGANTFAGPATVTDGTLELQGGAAIGDTTAVIVNASSTAPATSGTLLVTDAETIGSLSGNGGSVVLTSGLTTGGDDTSTSYAGIISGDGSLIKEGAGVFTLTGANTYAGGTVVNAGTLEGNSTSLQGGILVNAAGTLLFTQPTDGTFGGALSGTGTTTKAGAGILILSGDNSAFTGTTNINGGALSIGAATNIGTGPLTFDGGTLITTGALSLANPITLNEGGGTIQTNAATTLSGVIDGAGALTKTGTDNLTLAGANSYTGGTTVTAGTLTGTTVSIQGDVVDNSAVVFDQGFDGTYAGNLSGTGTVGKAGTSTVIFSGNNTYSGATSITAGALYASSGTGIGDLSAVTVASGAEFEIGGGGGAVTETIGSLAGAGDFSVNDPADHLITGNDNTSTLFSGTATGGQIEKIGTGVFTVSGTGNLSSGLTVTGGTFAIADGGNYTATTSVASGATLDVQPGTDDGETTTPGGLLTGDVTTAAGSFARVNGQVIGNIDNAGTLSGSGLITGAVTNTGTVAPGNSPGVITIAGSYAQTAAGTLAIQITPSATAPVAGTNFDQVRVTGAPGTAALDGTLAIAATPGLYNNGTTYDIVLADGGITGAFAAVTGGTISPFLSLTPTGIVTTTGTQQAYRLTVSRTNYAVGLGASANANRVAVANGLQTLVTGATGDTATLITSVDNMSAAQAATFFDDVSPEAYGAYATAMQDQGELFTRQVALRLGSVGAKEPRTSLWGQLYGQWGSGKDDAYRIGSDADITGGVIGIDFGMGALTVGAAGGYSEATIKYRLGNSRGKSKSWQVGGYAAYQAGPIGADLQLAYINGQFDATKSIVAGTVNRATSASFDGNLFKAVGTVGYDLGKDNVKIRPFVGVDFSTGKAKAFTETGAGAANLSVNDINADRTDLLAGIEASGKFGGLAPYGRLTYRYRANDNNRAITANFAGAPGSAFTVSGVTPGRSEADIDLGLRYGIGEKASVSVGYQAAIRDDVTRHGVSAQLSFAF